MILYYHIRLFYNVRLRRNKRFCHLLCFLTMVLIVEVSSFRTKRGQNIYEYFVQKNINKVMT